MMIMIMMMMMMTIIMIIIMIIITIIIIIIIIAIIIIIWEARVTRYKNRKILEINKIIYLKKKFNELISR